MSGATIDRRDGRNLAAGMDDVGIMSDEDIKSRATWAGRIREQRMWDYLTDGDPEGG